MRKKEKVVTHGTNTIHLMGLLYIISFFSCSTDREQDNTSPIASPLTGPYTIESSQLLENGQEVHFKGVNALQTYGLTDVGLMNQWNIEITREFIGNLREQPTDGGAILASDGVWYHPLQQIVDQNRANNRITNYLQWSPFERNSDYFNPSKKEFMINYRVQNIVDLVEQLKADGVEVLDEINYYDYGKFVHIMDNERNKIELWEPVDIVFTTMGGKTTK